MPDASGGIASGLYWVATGKMPIDEIEGSKDESKDDPKVQGSGGVYDPKWSKDTKAMVRK